MFVYFQNGQSSSTGTVTGSCAECSGNEIKGPKGQPEPLSSCDGCGMTLHSTCANNFGKNLTNIPLTLLVAKGSKWYCEDCKSCESCNSSDLGPHLDCCSCHKNYHFSCLDPVPDKKPKCPWR